MCRLANQLLVALLMASACCCELVTDDGVRNWTSPGYPKPYRADGSRTTEVQVEDGYKILVAVQVLDLDGEHGDYLSLTAETPLNGGNGEGEDTTRILTYNLKAPRTYAINSNRTAFHFQVAKENDRNRTGFWLTYQRIGDDASITTEYPTTSTAWPSANDSAYVTAYLAGQPDSYYRNESVLGGLKSLIAAMGNEYCENNNISLNENASASTVFISRLMRCPYTWPDVETCVELRFALPVSVDASYPWRGYQLNRTHLEAMWRGQSANRLETMGLAVYKEPDASVAVFWLAGACAVLVLSGTALIVLRTFGDHRVHPTRLKRASSDLDRIIPSNRTSAISLTPHPLQSLPSLFGEAEEADDRYLDGVPPTYSRDNDGDYANPFTEDDEQYNTIFSRKNVNGEGRDD